MATLTALSLQDPFWIWLSVGCLFVALNLATGQPLLMWPAGVAALVAIAALADPGLGFVAEAGLFAVLCLVLAGGGYLLMGRMTMARASSPRAAPPGRPVSGSQEQTARLVGRIGRTTSEFVNGVGRVWIDGAEWGAEIDAGEIDLPPGAPVRVVKVIGGIRLQVHALAAG